VQCTQDLLVQHAQNVLCGVAAMSGRAVHTGSSGKACAKCSVWGHSNEWSCSAHRIFWYSMRNALECSHCNKMLLCVYILCIVNIYDRVSSIIFLIRVGWDPHFMGPKP
jgi:hypothetical protein